MYRVINYTRYTDQHSLSFMFVGTFCSRDVNKATQSKAKAIKHKAKAKAADSKAKAITFKAKAKTINHKAKARAI